MALTLRLRSGGITPAPELQFDAARLVVGRAAGSDLQLPDPSVSNRHASLRQRGSDYVVVDEGSENGTFSGSERLTARAPHTLRDGELLRFGRVWVEVGLAPSQGTTEPGASRELARRLVEHALAADGASYGMLVSEQETPAGEAPLRLEKPRQPYVIGSQKSADLRLAGSNLPGRAAELRRQGDQVSITLVGKDLEAQLDARALSPGERVAWPRTAVLTLGGARFTLADATAQTLERLERGPAEILTEAEPIEPPEGLTGAEDGAEAEDEAEAEVELEDEPGPAPSRGGPSQTSPGNPSAAVQSAKRGAPWTSLDAVLFVVALGMLGLSLWVIRWLAQLGSA